MEDLGEVLDPIRKQVIDVKDALVHARYRYDALELLMETVSDPKLRSAAQEIFTVASEQMDAIDHMLDDHYRQLSAIDRALEGYENAQRRARSG